VKRRLQLPRRNHGLPRLRGPQPHLGLALLGLRKDLALLASEVFLVLQWEFNNQKMVKMCFNHQKIGMLPMEFHSNTFFCQQRNEF
jgi:hypothetical protein